MIMPQPRSTLVVAWLLAALLPWVTSAQHSEQSGEDLQVAADLEAQASRAAQGGDSETAERLYQRAVVIRERQPTPSLQLADDLNRLGNFAKGRGDFAAAAEIFQRSLEIREQLAPNSLLVGKSLSNLGGVLARLGQLDRARRNLQRSLAIKERLAPGELTVSYTCSNLGNVAIAEGDLGAAEGYYQRALAIAEERRPDSLQLATSLNNLANVAQLRGEPEIAEPYLRRALAIKREHAPDSLTLANTLNNLGQIVYERQDFRAAAELFEQALAIKDGLEPDSLAVASSVHNLGQTMDELGDRATAERFVRRALAIYEARAAGSLWHAETLLSLGELLADKEPRAAESTLRQAAGILERVAPGSLPQAQCWSRLGALLRAGGRGAEAADALERAIEALESQIRRLGGHRVTRRDFRARHLDVYRRQVELLVDLERQPAAYRLLERSRAQTFLAMLTDRDLELDVEIPPELAQRRLENARRHDRLHAEFGALATPSDDQRIEGLLDDLARLDSERQSIAEAIRRASPRLGALRYPVPLDLDATRLALDPNAVLLSYQVGPEATLLFAVSRSQGLQVHLLAIGAEELAARVERFRQRIVSPVPGLGGLLAEGKSLYDTLVRPAAELIEVHQRILFVPDRALHALPFAALVRSADGGEGWSYLAEWRASHTVLSATVYAQLTRERLGRDQPVPEPVAPQLVAFGDPDYPDPGVAPAAGGLELLRAVAAGRDFAPLPASRLEVAAVASHFSGGQRIYLGREATEERAKQIGPEPRFVHFASHAFVDPRRSLDSGLVLSLPPAPAEDRDNGILQAWEILESVRLDADLVVLSGCDTGRGREIAGEGLIGLARAFQHAGARAVVASLWQVADLSTVAFMDRFYRHLLGGRGRAEALRAAQQELLSGPVELTRADGRQLPFDASHPRYWAGFQLIGDGR